MSRLFATAAATTVIAALLFIWTLAAVRFGEWPAPTAWVTGAITGALALATGVIAARDSVIAAVESLHAANILRTELLATEAERRLQAAVVNAERHIRQQMTDQLQHVLTIFARYVHDEEQVAAHLSAIRAEGGAPAHPKEDATVIKFRPSS